MLVPAQILIAWAYAVDSMGRLFRTQIPTSWFTTHKPWLCFSPGVCSCVHIYACILVALFHFRFMTLEPGDVVLTGTPPGVGCFRKPPLYLKVRTYIIIHMYNFILVYCIIVIFYVQSGDVVECEIDEIGTIRNVVQ